MLHGQEETTQRPRIAWFVLHFFLVAGAGWIYFGAGSKLLPNWDLGVGDMNRRIVLMAFGVLFLLRGALTGFFLLKRKFGWSEVGGVLSACFIYQIGYALLGSHVTAPIGPIDYFAVVLFLLGSYLNTGSELGRKKFKERPENKGKLYTGGLFVYARHINYFGDILWVCGWALMTHNLWAGIIPIILALGFNFAFIPPPSQVSL